MKWDEIIGEGIINEGSDAFCPNCDDYLGKASEVYAPENAPASCGRCGWSDGKKAPVKTPARDKSVEKTSGDYRVRVNSSKTQAELFYEGPSVSIVNKGDNAGTATKKSDGVYVAHWQVDFYNHNAIEGTFPTLTQAVNAVKRMHQAKVKGYMKTAKKHGWKIGEEVIDEDAGQQFMGVASIPDWSVEDDQLFLVFANEGGHEVRVHKDETGISCEVDHSWDKGFSDEASAEAWLRNEGYSDFVGVDDE